VPKKSRRDRKREQPRSAGTAAPSTAEGADIPLMDFTDFSADADENDAAPESSDNEHSNSIDSVLARSEAAMKSGTATTAQAAAPADAPRALRRVQSKQPSRATASARSSGGPAATTPPLPLDSAAVPLSTVPYVPSDLRRVGLSALVIVIVIIAGGILVTNLFH
jgi:hypothetical protein